jgi:hypothetical protein
VTNVDPSQSPEVPMSAPDSPSQSEPVTKQEDPSQLAADGDNVVDGITEEDVSGTTDES